MDCFWTSFLVRQNFCSLNQNLAKVTCFRQFQIFISTLQKTIIFVCVKVLILFGRSPHFSPLCSRKTIELRNSRFKYNLKKTHCVASFLKHNFCKHMLFSQIFLRKNCFDLNNQSSFL